MGSLLCTRSFWGWRLSGQGVLLSWCVCSPQWCSVPISVWYPPFMWHSLHLKSCVISFALASKVMCFMQAQPFTFMVREISAAHMTIDVQTGLKNLMQLPKYRPFWADCLFGEDIYFISKVKLVQLQHGPWVISPAQKILQHHQDILHLPNDLHRLRLHNRFLNFRQEGKKDRLTHDLFNPKLSFTTNLSLFNQSSHKVMRIPKFITTQIKLITTQILLNLFTNPAFMTLSSSFSFFVMRFLRFDPQKWPFDCKSL